MRLGDDIRWMAAAIALASRGRGLASPNPNVGCVIIKDGRVVGRGWTAPGGRPHAEAQALAQAGSASRGATIYVTLEPCAHDSARGPACAATLVEAGVARVVAATQDPDPRTNGAGLRLLAEHGIAVTSDVLCADARAVMAGWWSRATASRAYVTLKLATSLDGCIAMADGTSQWITGPQARAHAHVLRARSDAILVGRGTLDADDPRLDVRLAGLEGRSPQRLLLTRGGSAPAGWIATPTAHAACKAAGVNDLLVEGGAQTAASFIAADLVDEIILYRAPILIGAGRPCLGDIGLAALADSHGRWVHFAAHQLGKDRVDVYHRAKGI